MLAVPKILAHPGFFDCLDDEILGSYGADFYLDPQFPVEVFFRRMLREPNRFHPPGAGLGQTGIPPVALVRGPLPRPSSGRDGTIRDGKLLAVRAWPHTRY